MTDIPASELSTVSRFDDSVFISYSHADNVPFGLELGHGERSWVSFLGEELAKRLRMVSGDETSVWRDPKLQGNDVFAEELVERLARCAVLVSVCSPKYLSSEWCRRELEEFVRVADSTGGLQVGTKSRVFKVVKTPVERDDFPAPLEPLLGYEFYGVESDGDTREFLLMHHPEGLVLFYQKLDDLVRDIARLLDQIDEDPGSDEPRDQEIRSVFLANTSSDIARYRDDLERELDRRGHRVLPDQAMPLVVDQLSQVVDADLDNARLSVHMLGARYGTRPEGDERSIAHIQLDLAREAAADGGLTQLIWLPESLEAVEGHQQELIDDLEKAEVGLSIELVRGSFESFKTYVLDRLAEPDSTGSASEVDLSTRRVYLVHDAVDRAAATGLREQLEARGLRVMTPLGEGTEAEIRELHQESMVLTDAVLIYYGEASEHWARMKINDLIKARGWGRQAPFLATGVVVGPPETPAKAGFHTSEALVIVTGDRRETPALERFLIDLERSGTSR